MFGQGKDGTRGQRAAPHTAGFEALGQSEAFIAFQESLSRVAQVDRPVLIIGERGTGKELAAARLHFLSKRWQEPLVALNCAALSPTLIESELFGHEHGAFTGAVKRRSGRFEAANGGTLFLDEIGNIPTEAQEKILRAVEYGTFERVGGTDQVQVDVRIIGATNANLPALAERGTFKRDLLDRLSFEVLYLPPLRERQEDIMLLANFFASRMAYELGRTEIPEFTEGAIAELEAYPWPGNIRELKNVAERAVYRSSSRTIHEIIFDPFQASGASAALTSLEPARQNREAGGDVIALGPFNDMVQDMEIKLLRRALEEAHYNQKRAAELLDLTYHQFRGLFRKYQDVLQG